MPEHDRAGDEDVAARQEEDAAEAQRIGRRGDDQGAVLAKPARHPGRRGRAQNGGHDVDEQQRRRDGHRETKDVAEEEDIERAHPAGAQLQRGLGEEEAKDRRLLDERPVVGQWEAVAWNVGGDLLGHAPGHQAEADRGQPEHQPAHHMDAVGVAQAETRPRDRNGQDDHIGGDADHGQHAEQP